MNVNVLSATERNKLLIYNLDASQRHYNKQKKLITKGHKLYDFIYITFSRVTKL